MSTASVDQEWFTASQAARRLGFSVRTLQRYVKAGRLKNHLRRNTAGRVITVYQRCDLDALQTSDEPSPKRRRQPPKQKRHLPKYEATGEV